MRALTVAPPMKVEVENQPQGLATLRIELPPEEVRKEWDSIASNYSRYARIPGYRAGKAPFINEILRAAAPAGDTTG